MKKVRKISSKLFFRISILILIFVLCLQNLTLSESSEVNTSNVAFLQAPQVSGEAKTFLEKEAGICAYVYAGKTLDLSRAKTVYRTIEKETDTYIIGSVGLKDYSPSEDPHVFVHKEGWIVAYYSKSEPVSKIVDWKNYTPRLVSTKLYQVLSIVCGAVGASLKEMKYYHYAYPGANKLMIIVDKDQFILTIPSELSIYEISFSIGGKDYEFYKFLNITQFTLDIPHTIILNKWYYPTDFTKYGYYIAVNIDDEKIFYLEDVEKSLYNTINNFSIVIVFQEL